VKTSALLNDIYFITYVPQGSVLGALLYVLFINDPLQAFQEATVVLFAGDTNILLTDNDLIKRKNPKS
jgi:hypothetical protein